MNWKNRARNRTNGTSLRRLHASRGQALVFLTLSLSVLFGLTALVVDFGVTYHDQAVLNAATQAAALAGAEAMGLPGATATSVNTAVTTYGSPTGDDNYSPLLSSASMVSGYPAMECLTTLQNKFGTACYGPSSTNAIVVKQQVVVPLFFMRIFGVNSITLKSEATAAMRGASASPYNVAIILDTTASMNSTDSSSNCSNTRISCALAGVQVLLKTLAPCATLLTSCGTVTNGNVANPVDSVSLFAFPAVTTASVANDYNCGGAPTTAAYATPFPSTSTYQIVNFSSDYRSSDTASSLRTSSNLVAAVAGTSGTPCLQVVGGYGTYYAQVIYAAQAALVTEHTANPNSQNVMIILGDGDANATSAHMPGASTSSGTYMSTLQQCHQAVTAAQAAATAGTLVYTVAYGATASGCSTDTSPTITPCQTMQQMASSSGYFFSDYTATGGSSSCISSSQPTTSLNQIFKIIAGDLTLAKLIPNGTT
jgi:Putative Tad-like Flp pilus-assembly